jgi:Transcriptional regulatory protein, C terminal
VSAFQNSPAIAAALATALASPLRKPATCRPRGSPSSLSTGSETALRKGTTLTKEMFLNHLYGGMDEPELKIIDVFTCKLRKKLANASNGKNYIETVWGRGYVLCEPVETQEKIPA